MNRAMVVAGVVCLCLLSMASADEIQFINGDRLTGKIKFAADGKILITTDVAGDVVSKMLRVE